MTSLTVIKAPEVPDWKDQFYRLNAEWLNEFYFVTPQDEIQLRDTEKILNNGGAVLFAVSNGQVAGTCALIHEGNGVFEIAKMGVSASERGKGIGGVLLDAALEEAFRLGAVKIYLETAKELTRAIRLYQSKGFVVSGPEHTHPLFGRTTFAMEYKGPVWKG